VLHLVKQRNGGNMKYFYPDFRMSNRIEIYEATDRYSSGYVLIGALDASVAMSLHPEWVWLTPENREKASRNFDSEVWYKKGNFESKQF
jgi:hypothetical protein